MEDLQTRCLNDSSQAEGVYVEFGICSGANFHTILKFAKARGKVAYAVDSFIGLAEPTVKDFESGRKYYPKGRFDQGGPEGLVTMLDRLKFETKDYVIVEGYVPASLSQIEDIHVAFAYVDLDHYHPTKCVLEFLLTRMNENSIILCDDYFEDGNGMASLAYKEFFSEQNEKIEIIEIVGRKISWKLKKQKKKSV